MNVGNGVKELIQDIIKTKKLLYLVGESHGIEYNNIFKFNFVKNLVYNYNINTIFIEDSILNSYEINQFLKSNDNNILKELFQRYHNTYLGTKDNYDFLLNLKNLNYEIGDPIYVVGVDIMDKTLNYINALRNMQNIVNITLKNVIYNLINIYTKIVYDKENLLWELYHSCHDSMQVVKEIKNKTEYDIQVEDIIYSLYFKIQVKIFFGRAREIREYALYNNIVRTIARNSNSELVYFGQFGTSHLHQAYVEYKNMLTHLLGSIQYKNINATMLLYKNCQQIIYKNASWSKSDKNLNNIFQKALFNEDISSKDLILGKDMKSAISLFLDEAFIHKDYINNYINQYVIIKDSRSSTML